LPLVVHADVNYDPHLRTLTNIYGVLALAGAMLGFWRIWRRAEKPRALLSLPSFWISVGLAIWVIAQVMWVFAKWKDPEGEGPGPYDIAYIIADICWIVALFTVFKALGREVMKAISPFMAIITTVLILLIGGLSVLDHSLLVQLNFQ